MWGVIIILILVGILLLLLEILVIPGTGFAGVAGFASMVAGIWIAYADKGSTQGNITLIAALTANILAVVIALRSKTWKKARLQTAIDGKTGNIIDDNIKPGDRGKTVSRCAPGGKIIINGKYYEAHAGTQFIDPGTEVEITKTEKNKIFIKPLKSL